MAVADFVAGATSHGLNGSILFLMNIFETEVPLMTSYIIVFF